MPEARGCFRNVQPVYSLHLFESEARLMTVFSITSFPVRVKGSL